MTTGKFTRVPGFTYQALGGAYCKEKLLFLAVPSMYVSDKTWDTVSDPIY